MFRIHSDSGWLQLCGRRFPPPDPDNIQWEDVAWVPYPEDATEFRNEDSAEPFAVRVRDLSNADVRVVVHEPEEGYFVITAGFGMVLLKTGGFSLVPEDENAIQIWRTRFEAERELAASRHDLIASLEPWQRKDCVFCVEHIAELYGCDPCLWEKENLTPDLPAEGSTDAEE